jgi:hypothetical protein
MCVIYACGTKLPPEDELRSGAFKNDDGAGIAWLHKGEVHWQKGLKDEQDVLKYIEDHKIPFPLAIHFRTASVGGKSPELCHPFPVAEGVPLWVAGKAPEVLMHNGHLSGWEDLVLKAGLASAGEIPEGDWSDSRALAYLTFLKGHGILRFITQTSRVMTLSAEAQWQEDFPGDPWAFFSFWGNWEGKREDGFIQSIKTNWANKGGVIVHRGAAWDGYVMDPDDSTPAEGCKVSSNVENVWTIQELSEILVGMEKELEDARTAARS